MSARNLNPHAEARVAMALWSERYSKQTLGCMDFYDGLTAAQKSTCAQIVDGIIYADRADGRTPAPSTISVLTSDPIAWAEVYDEKIVAVQLDKSKWHTTPLYLSAPAELSVGDADRLQDLEHLLESVRACYFVGRPDCSNEFVQSTWEKLKAADDARAALCAITAGINLEPAVIAEFNSTSEKNGLATKLRAALPSPMEGGE